MTPEEAELRIEDLEHNLGQLAKRQEDSNLYFSAICISILDLCGPGIPSERDEVAFFSKVEEVKKQLREAVGRLSSEGK